MMTNIKARNYEKHSKQQGNLLHTCSASGTDASGSNPSVACKAKLKSKLGFTEKIEVAITITSKTDHMISIESTIAITKI